MPPALPPSLALPPGLSEAMLAELTELYAHLAPRDVFERLLATRVVQAAARVLLSAEREPLEPNALWLRHEVAADRLLRQSLAALERHRRDHPVDSLRAPTIPPAPPSIAGAASSSLPTVGGSERGGDRSRAPEPLGVPARPDPIVRGAQPVEASGRSPVPAPSHTPRMQRPATAWPPSPLR